MPFLPGLQLAAPVAVQQRYMFYGTRLKTPSIATPPTVTNATQYLVSRLFMGTGPYPGKNARFVVTNFNVLNTGGGTFNDIPYSVELAPGNTKLVQGLSVLVGATWYRLTFGGQDSVTVPDGGFAITDPLTAVDLPADSMVEIRFARYLPVGAIHSGGYRLATAGEAGVTGEAVRYQATDQSALLMSGGAITTANNNGQFVYFDGPVGCVAQGWDGRPVALLYGDSIVHAADYSDARGNSGYGPRGLDDSSGGRILYGDVSVGGGSWRNHADNALAGQKFGRRLAMLRGLAALNGGPWPFTFVFSEMGVNDAAGVASEPDPYEAWRQRFTTGWGLLQAAFPGVPLVQSTMTPRNASADTYFWTDPAQVKWSVATDGPGVMAPRQRVNAWLRGRPAPLAAVIDVAPAFYGPEGDRHLVPPGSGVLSAASAVSAAVLTTSAPPRVGDYLVMEPGVANSEISYPVLSVTGNGPYTVTLATGLTKAHAAGAAWGMAATRDGTHPSPGRHAAAAQILVAAKAQGVF